MAISKVADRATANTNAANDPIDLSLSDLTVGNVLIIRLSGDNSGGGGAGRTLTVSNLSGTAIDTATLVKLSQNNDPGAASAGLTGWLIWAVISASSGTVRLDFSGSLVAGVIAEEWSGIDTTAMPTGGITNFAQASTFAPTLSFGSIATGGMAYVALGDEGPSSDTASTDSDTTNGSWQALTKVGTTNATATDNQTIFGQYKIVTAAGTQTWGASQVTISASRDTAALGAVFLEAVVVRHQRHMLPNRPVPIFQAVR